MSAPLLPNPVTVEIDHPTVDAEVFVPQVTPEVTEQAVGVIVVPVEGGGGGGGAGIDDSVTGPDTTWSSEHISTDRSPAKWLSEVRMFGGDRGSPVDTGMSLTNGVDMAFETAVAASEALGQRVSIVDLTGTLTAGSEVTIVAAGSGTLLDPGRLYAIRAADGIITWRLPS